MLTELLHRIAAHPWIYDRIQTVAGNQQVLQWISEELRRIDPKVVVDMGGGTGSLRKILAADCKYVCLDLEMPKLEGFRSKFKNGLAVVGDATSMPIDRACADLVVCKSVTHHLTDTQLDQAFDESRRILRNGGHIALFDAVWSPKRIAGRLLWSLDRGSYPRASEDLRRRFSTRFRIVRWERFAIYHEYVLAIGERLAGHRGADNGCSLQTEGGKQGGRAIE
jgi:ubiquinone/menaquinone biosynthesis C-methylase UbiE